MSFVRIVNNGSDALGAEMCANSVPNLGNRTRTVPPTDKIRASLPPICGKRPRWSAPSTWSSTAVSKFDGEMVRVCRPSCGVFAPIWPSTVSSHPRQYLRDSGALRYAASVILSAHRDRFNESSRTRLELALESEHPDRHFSRAPGNSHISSARLRGLRRRHRLAQVPTAPKRLPGCCRVFRGVGGFFGIPLPRLSPSWRSKKPRREYTSAKVATRTTVHKVRLLAAAYPRGRDRLRELRFRPGWWATSSSG